MTSSTDVTFREGSFVFANAVRSADDSTATQLMNRAWNELVRTDKLPPDDEETFTQLKVDDDDVTTDDVSDISDTLVSPIRPTPAVVEVNDEEKQYAITGIIGRREPPRLNARTGKKGATRRTNKTEYLVQWEGDYDPSWEPYENLRDAANESVEEFDQKVKTGQIELNTATGTIRDGDSDTAGDGDAADTTEPQHVDMVFTALSSTCLCEYTHRMHMVYQPVLVTVYTL